MTLNKRYPENPKYRVLKTFIIPAEGGMTPADRWRLEISAQQGQGRLLKDYDAVERLLKISEGVDLLNDQNGGSGRDSAIQAVARDFGLGSKQIREELDTLKHMTNYLEQIGHPKEWWQGERLTEVFTEWEPMEKALHTNAIPFDRRARMKAGLYDLIKNGVVDYRFMREVRTAIGPVKKTKGAKSVQSAVNILIDHGPSADKLVRAVDNKSKKDANDVADAFRTELQSRKEEERPEVKARRAESNLKTVVDILTQYQVAKAPVLDNKQLEDALDKSKDLAIKALELLNA
jgi:hypothetical protein